MTSSPCERDHEDLSRAHARFLAARRDIDRASADEATLARVEAAAGAVMRVPATDAKGAALKLEVLRTWYLADFWTDGCWDDAAGEAVRTAFAEISAILEHSCDRDRRVDFRLADLMRGEAGGPRP